MLNWICILFELQGMRQKKKKKKIDIFQQILWLKVT